MSKEKQIIPELRFPEFIDTGDWEDKTLGNIAELSSSKRVHLADYVNIGIPFFRGKEISELKKGIIPTDILFISEAQYTEINNKYGVPKTGDILMTAVGTLGNVYRIVSDKKFYFKDGNLIWIKNISVNSMFLEILLDVRKKEVLSTAIGSSQKALTMKALNKLFLSVPSNPKEQQKIANCLSSLDDVITAETEKLDLLQDHKKGLLQQLFPTEGENRPHYRFPEFIDTGDWEDKTLGNIAELSSSKRVHLADYVNIGIPFFRGKEISELKKGIIPTDILFISEAQYTEIKNKYGVPKTGDILMTAVGTLGNVYRIVSDKKFYFKDGNLIWIKNISVNSMFLEILLDVRKKEVLSTAIGSSQKALTMKALNKLFLSVPSNPKEQQKIAKCLSSVDDFIESQVQKVKALKKHKKGLMQQLFPKANELAI